MPVYPRVGGGTPSLNQRGNCHASLSPRGRGNLHRIPCAATRKRSIPAWAGEPSRRLLLKFNGKVYPRVGGGTLTINHTDSGSTGLSPRGRGNHRVRQTSHRTERSIPAWAGEPSLVPYRECPRTVYPRVGGGTLVGALSRMSQDGLSPRGRGNRQRHRWGHLGSGSIPAWAGEPARGART